MSIFGLMSKCSICIIKKDGLEYFLLGTACEMQGEAEYSYELIYINDEEDIVMADNYDCVFSYDEMYHDDK